MADSKLSEYSKESESSNAIAHELAKQQRDISVAEFFEKNRHLLGFDNKRKALLTVVKEAVDNSLDACQEASVLPEISVEIIDMQNDRFRVIIEDNGPGIVKKQIPNIFAKLLYGSKFHKLKSSRGQQGIGISAAVMYAQLTTGRPAKITSKIHPSEPANYFELHLDTQKNKPEIVKEETKEWKKNSGTRIEMDIEATYIKGAQSVDEYLKETAIINPHLTLIYTNPKAEQVIYARTTEELPKEPKEIKPHPYGVELGALIKMMKTTESRTMQAFLTTDFSRVGAQTAKDICSKASILPNYSPSKMSMQQAEQLKKAIFDTKIIAPPTDCVVPIGADLLESSLKKELKAEFYASTTRPASVYRGNPFLIECAVAYGGNLEKEVQSRIMRFANRVPLLYQQGACAITKSIASTNWKAYGLQQSQGSLPVGPIVVIVHIASVWVPFTSEAKEAVAHYPEIVKEIKLALQECGRKLMLYISKKRRVSNQMERINIFENYIPEVADALSKLSGVSKFKITESMKKMLQKNKEFIKEFENEQQKVKGED